MSSGVHFFCPASLYTLLGPSAIDVWTSHGATRKTCLVRRAEQSHRLEILSGYHYSLKRALAGGAQAHGRRGGGAGRAMQQLQSRGGGVNSNSGVMSERAAWMALVEDLKKR